MCFKNFACIRGPATLSLAGVFLLVVMAGCHSTNPDFSNIQIIPERFDPGPPPKVTLAPGDEVDVKFYHTPELNESQRVRPDGVITLQLVGDVLVQGKTPMEIRKELIERFSPLLQNPDVAVIVRSLVNRRVYVGGEVYTPGLIEMPGRLTALESIMQAGGFNLETAEVGNVVIIRHINNRRYGCALDFEEALEGKEYDPFLLEPGDIVYVPQTSIYQVTQWIDQHINRVIPLGFTYTVESGSATIGMSTYGRVIH